MVGQMMEDFDAIVRRLEQVDGELAGKISEAVRARRESDAPAPRPRTMPPLTAAGTGAAGAGRSGATGSGAASLPPGSVVSVMWISLGKRSG